MNKNHKINKKIFELDKKDISYAIATVINIKGSSSSKTGDKALYNEQRKSIRLMLSNFKKNNGLYWRRLYRK